MDDVLEPIDAGSSERVGSVIGAVDNVLRLLRLFEDREILRVNEIAREMSLSRSTVHRMLTTLAVHGYVEQDPLSRGYRPGPTLVDVGLAVVRKMGLRATARPILESLAVATGETVHLAVLRGRDVVYLDGIESEKVLRAGERVGTRLPAYATAAGKAILSRLPVDDVQRLFPAELASVTPASVTTRDELIEQIHSAVSQGYAVNMGESEKDIGAVAVAVVDQRGHVHGSLVTTAPLTRIDRSWILSAAGETLRAAETLSTRLP